MKNRKNIGISNLTKLNVENIAKKANLKENTNSEKGLIEKKEKPKYKTRLVNFPEKLDQILVQAKNDCKITGGIVSYMVAATREKMERDGLI